jgi:hypothetical protein
MAPLSRVRYTEDAWPTVLAACLLLIIVTTALAWRHPLADVGVILAPGAVGIRLLQLYTRPTPRRGRGSGPRWGAA